MRKRFERVVFGATSSPFLLNGMIRKDMRNYEFDEEFVRKVLDYFNVHDFLSAKALFELFELF